MKVLHVIPAVAVRYGGPSQAIYTMCQSLLEHGVEVLVATTDADGPNRLPINLEKVVRYKEVPTIFFRRLWSEALMYSPTFANWLEVHVSDFDLVHIHAVFSHACVTAARVCRHYGIPYIVRPLGTLDPWSVRQKPLKKKLFWHIAAKQMMQRAAAIHYTTGEEKRLVESTLRLQRGVVIPLGVDERLFQAKPKLNLFLENNPELKRHPYILSLCRLHHKKRLELLIEILSDELSHDGYRQWRLVIAGDGEASYVNSLKQLAELKGVTDRILFTGWLAGDEKIGALQGTAIFALPSCQENFGLSVLEAMACGVPVLISEHVNLAEVIIPANAGWVVKLEKATMGSVLCKALENEPERLAKGAAGRELFLRCFSWTAIAQELITLYSKLQKSTQIVMPRRLC